MGLIHPRDYDAWAAWERSHHRLRLAKSAVLSRVRREEPPPFVVTSRVDEPRVLAALDVARGTSVDALLAPLGHIEDAAILSRGVLPHALVPDGWASRALSSLEELPRSVKVVLSAGSFPQTSLPAHDWAARHSARFVVVQHGLLTPFAPPLPRDALLLAWSDKDAVFWSEGRSDVETAVVGSRLLWTAAQSSPTELATGRPVFLGQLHGTELPRRQLVALTAGFCRDHDAVYRPHPGEKDIVSRLVHRWWRSHGIRIDDGDTQLRLLTSPVVSVFSTGLLEAAAQGRPAWGYHPNPPAWLSEFWGRYAITQWGDQPTKNPVARGSGDPARSIAKVVARL